MVRVQVNEGILEGVEVQNEFGGKYYSFKGIPYAEPPVGELRFKAPKPPKAWKGVRSAMEHGPDCYQYDYYFTKKICGAEDCLYLNVYTPNTKPASPLPVMFWIHGGGFRSGSSSDDIYGPEFLVRHDIILVTINYRLGALGFLCLDTEDIPGNAGMKDQVAALRWVKENISNFGGDPNNITIFGESAGGASVSFLLVSPMSKGLFQRAIAQSGSANCGWATSLEPRLRAIAIAKKLGLDSEDDKELADFFKSLPVESLIKVDASITLVEHSSGRRDIQLNIVSEKDFGEERFFYGDVTDALRNDIHAGVDIIAGYCADEGLMEFTKIDFTELLYLANNFLESFVPKPIALNCSLKDQFKVARGFKKFYFANKKITKEDIDQLVKYYSAERFSFAIIRSQRLLSTKNTVYLYKFKCKSERNILAHVFGLSELLGSKQVVCHADDLPYLFPYKMSNLRVKQGSRTFKMIDNVTRLWTNFAKYGNPTPDDSLNVKWSPYTIDSENYLSIDEELTASFAPDKEEYEFWEAVLNEFLPNNF